MTTAAVFIVFVALAAGVSLPFAWTVRDREDGASEGALSLFFALVSFGAVIAGASARSMSAEFAFGAIEIAGMALAGALIAAGLARAAGIKITLYAGAVLIVFAVSLIVTASFLRAPPGRFAPAAAFFWVACTVGGLIFYRIKKGPLRAAIAREPLVALAAAYAAVHIVQILRIGFIFPGAELLVPVSVPAVIAAGSAIVSYSVGRRLAARRGAYAKSGLTEADAVRLFKQIETLMRDERPFRNPEFDREALAATLGVSARAAGEAVNRAAGLTVPSYLRRKRVEEADGLLRAEENMNVSLEALALEAGFRSRSRFYAAFEEHFGETPGARRTRLS